MFSTDTIFLSIFDAQLSLQMQNPHIWRASSTRNSVCVRVCVYRYVYKCTYIYVILIFQDSIRIILIYILDNIAASQKA
jgi:hypothetical protein